MSALIYLPQDLARYLNRIRKRYYIIPAEIRNNKIDPCKYYLKGKRVIKKRSKEDKSKFLKILKKISLIIAPFF